LALYRVSDSSKFGNHTLIVCFLNVRYYLTSIVELQLYSDGLSFTQQQTPLFPSVPWGKTRRRSPGGGADGGRYLDGTHRPHQGPILVINDTDAVVLYFSEFTVNASISASNGVYSRRSVLQLARARRSLEDGTISVFDRDEPFAFALPPPTNAALIRKATKPRVHAIDKAAAMVIAYAEFNRHHPADFSSLKRGVVERFKFRVSVATSQTRVDNVLQCVAACDNHSLLKSPSLQPAGNCIAVTFDSGAAAGAGNCMLFDARNITLNPENSCMSSVHCSRYQSWAATGIRQSQRQAWRDPVGSVVKVFASFKVTLLLL
jgi:hypothetical protein